MSLRDAMPLYPRILVERLPRQRKSGVLYVADDINKPVHEGVVLRVWEPREKIIGYADALPEQVQIQRGPMRYAKSVIQQSDLKPGDIVLFPHFAGSVYEDPAEPNVIFISESEVIGTVQLDATGVQAEVETMISKADDDNASASVDEFARRMMETFVMVPRRSFTQSGRSTDGVV